ncbi:putative ankyrin repeat protein [Penicillium rolfsii]|nr:putative ankyrin repeat protein [Penicillium rolfsii]
MMEAIQLDRVEFILVLLSHGFLIRPSFTRKTTVCKAKGVLECFLEAGWDINEPVDVLIPPVLCYAVEDTEITSWFLEHGANPNTRCEVDCTPLSYAVRNAPLSVIELMLDRGGDVGRGQLLQYAVCREKDLDDVIPLLVERGAPLNATMYQDGPTLMRFFPMSLGTALHVAIERGKPNAIRLLIDLGADTEVKDANGDTALEWAQKWNKVEMVRLLNDLGRRF